jgi:squalene synthase HpnC
MNTTTLPPRDSSSLALNVEAVMERVGGENFPVASRVLPRQTRRHLLAVYGFARLADELGDSGTRGAHSPQGWVSPKNWAGEGWVSPKDWAGEGRVDDRLAALDWLERDLERAYEGRAEHPLLARLQPTLRKCALPREPFARLIEANRVDQRVSRYETWVQLRGYCALSANPVGELVLGVLGMATPARIAFSDSICTALQLVEHCQDVAEDMARGRVYLPAEDLARFGCTNADLAAEHAGEPLRRVLAFEVTRAQGLLAEGAPLIDELRGRARLAVAAFLAGGKAALDAIESADYDVLAGPPRAGRGRRLLARGGVLVERHSGRR